MGNNLEYTLDDVIDLFRYLELDQTSDDLEADAPIWILKSICAVCIERKDVSNFRQLIINKGSSSIYDALYEEEYEFLPITLSGHRYSHFFCFKTLINWRLKRGK